MIKTIDIDTIEFAYDFYFKLSDMQLIEMKKDFDKKQAMIALYLTVTLDDLTSKYSLSVFYRFVLMVDYCFKRCYGTIPFIKNQTIRDRIAWVRNDILNNSELDGITNFAEDIIRSGQVDLIKFIEARCEEFILSPDNFTNDEGAAIFDTIINVTFLYHQEAEKLNPETNE